MEKITIEQIAALKLELIALEAKAARIKTALISVAALGAIVSVPVTFYLVGLF